jgi:hypothetical protein
MQIPVDSLPSHTSPVGSLPATKRKIEHDNMQVFIAKPSVSIVSMPKTLINLQKVREQQQTKVLLSHSHDSQPRIIQSALMNMPGCRLQTFLSPCSLE